MVYAIVLAGGKGKRMGAKVSKQYINIKEKPILYYTLKKFIDNKFVDKTILVIPKEEIDYCEENILRKYNLRVDAIVEGGKERQDSVFNALRYITNCDIVLIHDGARPMVTDKIIEDGIEYAKKYGAAAPGVIPKDTIKIKDSNNFSKETPNRQELVAVQTPQVFNYDLIKGCHEKVNLIGDVVTDDTSVVEKYGHKVYLYEGNYTNIKVTTPEDLLIIEKLL